MPTQTDAFWALDCFWRAWPHPTHPAPTVGTGTYDYTYAGNGVDVIIIDNGVRGDHQDFSGRMQTGFTTQPGSQTSPSNRHGTALAGVAAGTRAGAAKLARIHPYRFFDDVSPVADFNSESQVTAARMKQIECYDHILANFPAGSPVVIAQAYSFFYMGDNTAEYRDKIEQLINRGFPVIISAGNMSLDVSTFDPPWRGTVNPELQPHIINVGNTRSNHSLNTGSLGSNHGPLVDIYAPGTDLNTPNIGSSTAWGLVTGTSYSGPGVAGFVACIREANPTISPAAIKQLLIDESIKGQISGLSGNSHNRLLYTGFEIPTPQPISITPANLTQQQAVSSPVVVKTPELRQSPFADAALDGSPLMYFQLEETGGTHIVDVSGHHRVAEVVGPNLNTPGMVGSGALFDGIDDYIAIPAHVDFDNLSGFSIVAFIRVNGAVTNNAIFAKGPAAANDGIWFRVDGDDHPSGIGRRLRLLVNDGTNFHVAVANTQLALGVDYQVIVAFDTNSQLADFYVNGIIDASVPLPASLITSVSYPMRWGSLPNGLNPFNGVKDELLFYDYKITARQAEDLYYYGIQPSVVEIFPQNLTQQHGIAVPQVAQQHIISPANLAHAHALNTPVVGQQHIITPANLQQAHTIDATTMGQIHYVVPEGLTHPQTLNSPTVGVTANLEPASLTHTHQLETGNVSQNHIVQPGSLQQSQSLTSPLVTQVHFISPESLTHQQILTSPVVGQTSILVPQSLVHTQSLTPPGVTQTHTIVPAPLVHVHTLSNASTSTVGPAPTYEASGIVTLEGSIPVEITVIAGDLSDITVTLDGDISLPAIVAASIEPDQELLGDIVSDSTVEGKVIKISSIEGDLL